MELRGYLLFGLLFLFTLGLITFLAFLFAELLTVAGAGRLAVVLLLLVGSAGGLFFIKRADEALKDNRLRDFLSMAGFLLWFRLFEVAFLLTTLFSLLLAIPVWFSEQTFTEHKFLYTFLACFLLLYAGALRGAWKLTERAKERFLEQKSNEEVRQ